MRIAFAIVVVAGAVLAPAQDSRGGRKAAMETITAADLRKHLSVLAADDMRGRQTPSKELTLAAKYLASQFEAAGAKPGAPGGGWLQKKPTPVVSFDVPAARVTFSVNDVRVPLTIGEGIDVAIRGGAPVAIDQASIMVVPPAALKSREGTEALATAVKGKLVLVVIDGWTERRDPLEHFLARAEALEADGCVLVETAATLVQGMREYRKARLEAWQARRERREGPRPSIGIAVTDEAVKAHLLERVAAARGAENRPFALPDVTVSADVKTLETETDVSNVVAIVPAAPGPKAGEAVVFTAHYDHIGMTAPVDGDWIYNGADDDGSGSVALLELAQAFAALRPAPARKLIFCAFFGEEKGGHGARFYVEHPAHPLEKTVCDINIEMIGRSFDVGTKVAWVTGYEHSNLGEILAAGAADAGVRIIPDPYPRQQFFFRSDNVAFVRAKIPGHSISAGSTHADYHGVHDDVDRIEFENMESLVRAIFLGAARIADGSQDVRWKGAIPPVR